ncbi:hypothetical protein JG687_00003776 [Phytophthora cactorum]|uniref:Uncharacterized protein n=1 Tax=Phytophthora cactorum TaxID=29920 RepID=A0A329SS30_9STRA|nr:hypothetical protein Pcac1_g2156 [Phytophthora cactorum]KAG2826899.1 hypothetical protein PC112_g9069 [Phytophthora cactorum]KAG2828716.1 hypothetical protein PC111_g8048 [Phytophthora cactorum]KAG2858746.1 hypothetical protein PC113_g9539 [Phytophthora cactorum]KAG2909548.1 hypothetical protein PC114_g10079 [Phytophthora cactorum]
MKVEGTFFQMKAIAQMTRAALRIWQFVIKYTTKPLLSQGVEGDLALANNSRRKSYAKASIPTKKNGADSDKHIAFDDMCKLVKPDKVALYTPPTSQVVALANWESAPTFVLDEHLHNGFPKASTDRLLNKCNPFLSGKCRANSEDLTSEAPTVSTDCSTISENTVEELAIVEEEVNDIEEKEPVPLKEENCETEAEQVSSESEGLINELESESAQQTAGEKKQTPRWVRGRWVKCNAEQTSTVSSSPKTEILWKVRWVQVGYGRYTKNYVNGETGEKIAA